MHGHGHGHGYRRKARGAAHQGTQRGTTEMQTTRQRGGAATRTAKAAGWALSTTLAAALLAGCDSGTPPQTAASAGEQAAADPSAEPSDGPSPRTESTPGNAPDVKPTGVVFAAIQDATSWIVAAVDPTTGTTTYENTFTPADDDVRLDTSYRQMAGEGPLVERALFDGDLHRAVATKRMTDGTEHVGWIDREGTFTDITAANPSPAGFTSTTSDDTPLFGPDGAFYFARREPDGSGWKTDPAIWRLAGPGPTGAGAATTVHEANYCVNPPADIEPLCAGCSPFHTPGTPGTGAYRATDFIGTGAYLSTDARNSMVYRSPVLPKDRTDLLDWGTDGKALIPQTNRTVWAPVSDPQGRQVAFLSKAPNQGPTVAPELYVVDAQGGTPHLVPVGGGTLGGKNPTLLDWR